MEKKRGYEHSTQATTTNDDNDDDNEKAYFNMAMIANTSELHLYSSLAIMVFESFGSSGNSAMRRPNLVNWLEKQANKTSATQWQQQTQRSSPAVVERAQRVQLFERADQRLGRRRIHKVKIDQVVDAKRFQQQHGVAKVGALNLRHGVFIQFVFVRPRLSHTHAHK